MAPATASPEMEVDLHGHTTRSVRFRVTALATAIVAVLLLGVAIALLVIQQRSLTAAVDDGLRRRADDLAALVASTVPESLPGSDDDNAAQLVAEDGTVIVASPNLVGGDAMAPDPGEIEIVAERRLSGPEDTFRVLSRSAPSTSGRLIIHVATASDDVADSVAVLRNSLLAIVPLAIGLLAATIWWLVGRALAPVESIRREVTAISETDLDRRVPVPATDDEISRLAVTMNLMLDRLEAGVNRLQRFAADASHELRSPLARMRSEIEVDLANPAESDLMATHRSVLEEAAFLQVLVDDLLYLARADAGRQDLRNEPVDLDDLVLAEAERLQVTTKLAVDVSQVSAGQVVGDRSQLIRAVRNLGENAARHASTEVRLDLGESNGVVRLAVTDDGPGIPPGERERVFERFTRIDEARSRDAGGSGLGLAIVRDVAERHGGTVTIDETYSAGARFVVRLPGSWGSDVRHPLVADKHPEDCADDGNDDRSQNRGPEVVDGEIVGDP